MLVFFMKLILNILLVIGIAISSLAQTPKTELDVLTDNYNKAKERAVKPIDDKYKEELKKLLEKYSKQGNVVEVEKITPLLKDTIDIKSDDHLIIGSIFQTLSNTEFFFMDNGVGIRTQLGTKDAFHWKKIPNRLIQVTIDDGSRSYYFNILENIQFIGNTPTTVTASLIRLK